MQMLFREFLHPGITVSFANSIELQLLVLSNFVVHMHELIVDVVAEDDYLGVGVDLDALLRSQVH